MKTISLKVPDDVYEKIESYRKRENMNRTSYVMEAVVAYNRKIERDELARKLQAEAKNDRKLNREIIDDFDHLSDEGIK
ncbi:hypothetical protein [Marinoscillum furvescens]|uniref:Uncharacterized protein n=1 Tax=Marinoscillum furvescens DSM 4134 TaxID=1122208 RepID=A0A3D9L5M4_MARFU|nr:hypothetical protein [Marinoscillum furvescens]REE00576.1 hypothetical protein C7460_105205 [Marinoscillum furvescens DSM 4134]